MNILTLYKKPEKDKLSMFFSYIDEELIKNDNNMYSIIRKFTEYSKPIEANYRVNKLKKILTWPIPKNFKQLKKSIKRLFTNKFAPAYSVLLLDVIPNEVYAYFHDYVNLVFLNGSTGKIMYFELKKGLNVLSFEHGEWEDVMDVNRNQILSGTIYN